jgi:transcriptional regulator with XRE-family HTH domain
VLEVKRLRQAREWNQTELAYHAGLAPSVISQIENGKRDPSARTLRKLAEALGVEVGDLFPKGPAPQPSLEDSAQSDAIEEALAVLFRGLARRGQRIVQQSYKHGSSEALSRETAEFQKEGMMLTRIKGTPSIFGLDSDELAEAEDDYQVVATRIQDMLRQVVDSPEKAEESYWLSQARKSKAEKDREIEESRADAS